MPCFDPRDVIFITNKWDTIFHEDDDENEDEINRTWSALKSRLKEEWPVVKDENIFKLNLREVKYATFQSHVRSPDKRKVQCSPRKRFGVRFPAATDINR